MKLSKHINDDLTRARIILTFAGRDTVAIWNKLRGEGEPPIFTGWYWAKGNHEGGPFRCESAAMRDAWYRVVLNTEPPLIHSTRAMQEALKKHRSNIIPMRRRA